MPAPEVIWQRQESLGLGSWRLAYNYALRAWAAKPPYTKSYRYIVRKKDGEWCVFYESTITRRPRATCPYCQGDVAVNRQGKFYKHNVETSTICLGSGFVANDQG